MVLLPRSGFPECGFIRQHDSGRERQFHFVPTLQDDGQTDSGKSGGVESRGANGIASLSILGFRHNQPSYVIP